MKVLKKRRFAHLIDSFIIGFIFAPLTLLNLPVSFWFISLRFSIFFMTIPSFGFLLLIITVCCKDLVFRNASIGKKLFKLSIVDANGEIPSRLTIIKRNFFMQTFGYILYHISKERLIEWEEEKLHTKVIIGRSKSK